MRFVRRLSCAPLVTHPRGHLFLQTQSRRYSEKREGNAATCIPHVVKLVIILGKQQQIQLCKQNEIKSVEWNTIYIHCCSGCEEITTATTHCTTNTRRCCWMHIKANLKKVKTLAHESEMQTSVHYANVRSHRPLLLARDVPTHTENVLFSLA